MRVRPNSSDQSRTSQPIDKAVNALCPAQIWQLGKLAAHYQPHTRENFMSYRPAATLSLFMAGVVAAVGVPASHADNDDNTLIPNNHRLNNGVVSNVFTIQRQAGCTTNIVSNPQLRLAAQWHTDDVLHNRNLDGDIGSDGSTAQDRANAAGFRGDVAETVAINPALAISSLELLDQWYYNPAYLAIMQNCGYSQIGVWSENSLDRTVVVAVYGQPGPAAR
jgi:hypothetical protein